MLFKTIPNDESSFELKTETISLLKKIPKYVYYIFAIALFFFVYSPNEIILKGKIESGTQYSIEVEYKAERAGFFCASENFLNRPLFGNSNRKYEYVNYFPTLKENEHYLSIPDSKFFFSLCDYQIDNIKMKINNSKVLLFEKKDKLVYKNESITGYSKQIKLIKVEKNHYTLDIGAVNAIKTQKRSSYVRKRKNPFTTEAGIIAAYGPDYDRSRDYEKEYNDRMKF